VSQVGYSTCRYAYSKYPANLAVAHIKLEKRLLQLRNKNNLVLYVDGDPPAEKSGTHLQREENRRHHRQQAHQQLSSLQKRLHNNERIRKHHLNKLNKHFRNAFKWELGDRKSFVQYLIDNGYQAVLCNTETDIQIAIDCQPDDIVVSGDSDFLFYKSVTALWRPVGKVPFQKYLVYEKDAVCEALGLTPEGLVVLAVVSRNDYNRNIPYLGFATNRKLIEKLELQKKKGGGKKPKNIDLGNFGVVLPLRSVHSHFLFSLLFLHSLSLSCR